MSSRRLPWCLLLAVLLAGCGKDRPSGDSSGSSGSGGTFGTGSDADNRAEASKRLQQIGKALFDHHDVNATFPAGVVAKGGVLGLSWRVQLLPYLGEDALYNQFKLDEPWDGPTNKPLIEKMPKVYASAGRWTPPGKTHLRSFIGETAFLPAPPQPKGEKAPPPYANLAPGGPVRGRGIIGITDGTSNTLAVVEAVEPVEWTKPDDLPFYGPATGAPNPPEVPKLGGVFDDGFHGLMADGKVVFFPADLGEANLRALITATGGDNFGPEVMKVLYPEGRPGLNPKGPVKGKK
jgi:hypothetical protein